MTDFGRYERRYQYVPRLSRADLAALASLIVLTAWLIRQARTPPKEER